MLDFGWFMSLREKDVPFVEWRLRSVEVDDIIVGIANASIFELIVANRYLSKVIVMNSYWIH